MENISKTFLAVCPQEQVTEAKAARKKVEEAVATIQREKTKRKEAFKKEVLGPQNKIWLEGKASVGAVVSVFQQNVREKGIAIKPFWKKHEIEIKRIFGFGYNQASKHIVIYQNKEKLEKVFKFNFEDFPRNLDKLARIAVKFAQWEEEEEKRETTEKEMADFLKQLEQEQKQKQKRGGIKRKLKMKELEEEVRQLKKARVEVESKLQQVKEWLKEKDLAAPSFLSES